MVGDGGADVAGVNHDAVEAGTLGGGGVLCELKGGFDGLDAGVMEADVEVDEDSDGGAWRSYGGGCELIDGGVGNRRRRGSGRDLASSCETRGAGGIEGGVGEEEVFGFGFCRGFRLRRLWAQVMPMLRRPGVGGLRGSGICGF